MKNLLSIGFVCICLGAFAGGSVPAPVEDHRTQYDPGKGGANTATCYSTYRDPGLLGGGSNICVCGPCTRVKAKEYSDSGKCHF